MKAVGEFLEAATKSKFYIPTNTVPLRDIESAWTAPDKGARLVFQP